MKMEKIFIREGREETRRKAKTEVMETHQATRHDVSSSTTKLFGLSSRFFASFADKKVF